MRQVERAIRWFLWWLYTVLANFWRDLMTDERSERDT